MVGASAWLGWVDPSSSVPPDSPSWGELLSTSRSLVADGGSTANVRWRSVVIAARQFGGAFSSMLAAPAEPADHHFLVNLAGHAYATSRWLSQEEIDGHGIVRIAVVRSLGESPMSLAQVRCLRALIAALNEYASLWGTSSEPRRSVIPARLDDEWARVYGLESGTTIDLMASPSPAS